MPAGLLRANGWQMAWLAWCSLLLLRCGASYVPFADVEELKPTRLHEHCAEADEAGHRWCSRSVKKRLEDGGDIELTWKMHINPDRILSLDTEAEHGVRVARCHPGEMELDIPHTHLQHLEAGNFIVGSHFVHNCEHSPQRAVYHKVVQVKSKRTSDAGSGRMYRYHIATEAVPHMGHTARHIQFYFNYMPVEARETENPFPKPRTFLDRPKQSRRLFDFPNFLNPNSGKFQSGGQTSGSMQRQSGIVSFNPDQVSNFGWNWNFFMNQTQTPRFVIDRPDTQGSMVLKNPYIKAHAGCFLNFTSRFEGFMKAPHVQWQAGLKGHGIVQGRFEGALNSTRSMSQEASSYKISGDMLDNFPFLRLLKDFDHTKWFSPINHAVGPMPVSFEPGFQFQLEIYHRGPFSGYLAFGGATHGTMMPILHFDSLKGFEQTLGGELIDTTVYPPLYLIFTEVFEIGVRAEPIIHVKGDFAGFQNMQAAMHFRAYQNLTVSRGHAANFSVDEKKPLIIYPFRVVGPSHTSFNTRYKLKISAKGTEKESSPAVNWGEVEYHESVSAFSFGNFTDVELNDMIITVTLFQVDMTTNADTELGQGTLTVMSWKDGIGEPTPMWVDISDASNTAVANAQVYVVHKVNPVPFFTSRIKGIGMSFPSLTVYSGNIHNEYPSLGDCALSMHLVLGKRTYLVAIKGSPSSTSPQSMAAGTTMIELYPSFVDMWTQCAPTMEFCTSPELRLYCGATVVGTGKVPPFGLPVPPEHNLLADLLGVRTTTPPAVGVEKNTTLPQVTLVNDKSVPIAVVQSEVRMTPPTASSAFLSPAMAQEITLGQTEEFLWTVADCTANQAITFDVIPMRIVEASELPDQDLSKYRSIGDKYLLTVTSSVQAAVPGTCKMRSVHNIPAEQLPCSFAKDLSFNGPAFADGQQLILMVTWNTGTITHKIYSPPFVLTSLRRLRQLSAPTLPPRPNPQDGRMNDTLQSEACTRQDLKFNFGQGVEVRAEINNLGVPTAIAKDMPPMYQDDEDDGPVYATPWETMGGNQPAMEAKDFLPEGLCEMGLCDTMLPGCRQAQFKKLFFPRLVFNYSKEFDYDLNSTNSTTQKMLQEAMAWAFSAMPEAIEVALQELQQREQELKKQTAVPNYGFGNYGNQNQNQNQFGFGNPSQQQNNWFNQPQQNSGLGNTQQMPQAFGKWWNTQRRLSDKRMGVDQDGNLVEMPRKLMSHQVEIQFRDGLPYNVDHVLIKKMVKQGMLNVDRHNLFKKDKPEIVGFYLEDLGSITIPNQPESRTVFAGAAACAALAAAAVAGVLLSLRKRPASEGYEASLSSQGLE